jgi:hypothetical protein
VTLKSRHVGEMGFASYVCELRRLRVLSRSEVRSWLALHGAVIRLSEPPLELDSGVDEDASEALARELSAE